MECADATGPSKLSSDLICYLLILRWYVKAETDQLAVELDFLYIFTYYVIVMIIIIVYFNCWSDI